MAEFPSANQNAKDRAAYPFVLIGQAESTAGGRSNESYAKPLFEANNYDQIPNFYGTAGGIRAKYGYNNSLPLKAVIDRDGNIRGRWNSSNPAPAWALVDELLGL